VALNIDDDRMPLEASGTVTCVAARRGHLWPVTGWPGLLSRNAFTFTEWLLSRNSGEAAHVAVWHEERHDA
jgi:hypothetical protein